MTGARTPLGAPGLTTRNKKLLQTKGIATRSKDATNSSYLLLVVRAGAPSSVLAPSSDALVTTSLALLTGSRLRS